MKDLEALENIKHYDSCVGLHEDDYELIEKEFKALEIIKKFGNYQVIEAQGQWYIIQGTSFDKSPKLPISEEEALILKEVLTDER